VISLLRRSLMSSGGKDEGMFLMLVESQGFIEAAAIAKGLGLAHERSANLLSQLLLGPKRKIDSLIGPANGPSSS
jgi:hypothetical protein